MRISLAGRVSISNDRVLIDEARLPGRQGRLVFAYLVSEHARPVTRDELAEALWGATPPARWEKALGVIASKLRALLGELGLDGAKVLTSAFGCYRLDLPEGTWVDILAAAQAADDAEAALARRDAEKAGTEAATAASIARLPLLPGEEGAWVDGKRRELADIHLRALETLAQASLRSGDTSEAAKWAQEAITLEPFRESSYRHLMQAHTTAGNKAEALRVYERCRRLLSEELGAYPSPETEAIYRDLLKLSPGPARPDVAVPAEEPAEPEPARPEPARRPSRQVALALTLVGAAIAAALAVLLLTEGFGSTAGKSVGANAVGVIDAESGKVVSGIPVGAAPAEVAAARDAVWVTNSDGNSVSRIDPSTNDVRQTIQVGGGPAGIAVGAGAVWVANGLEGTVSRIDPATNLVVQTITVGNGPSGVAYGSGSVWVTNSADGTLSQIDPDTGSVRRTLPAVSGASGIAVGFGRIWVVSPSSGAVVALDPRSGQLLRRIGVGVDPNSVAAGAGAIWVANRGDGTISKIDPRAGSVTGTIQVGRRPDGLAAGPDGIWVANGADGTIVGIDPSSGETTKTIRLEDEPRGIALSPQGVYVAVRSTGSEHRGGTLRLLSIIPVASIDPARAYPPAVWPVLILTNDGLVGFRRVGGVRGAQLVPDLALGLPTPTNGGKAYTFQLRPGIRYGDGQLVQPDDFRRAIERVFELGDEAYFYKRIAGADRCVKGSPCDLSRGIVTDRAARTVTFHLTAPDADFLAKLALPPAFAVPERTSSRDVGDEPIPATGPYRIAEFRKETKTIRLIRNRGFREWSADAQPEGYPDTITLSWRYRLDPFAQVRSVERGAADIALDGPISLSKRQLDALAVRHPDQLRVHTDVGTTFFFLNTRVPPFDDVRVRRAVNHAFDREAFARARGRAFSPTCQILPPNFPSYRPRCPYASGERTSLDTARRLVRASGTAGARVSVWVQSQLAEEGRYMVSVLESIGYRASLKALDRDAYFNAVADSRIQAQTGQYTWIAGYPSAADFIPPQLSCAAFAPAAPGENANLSGFCDRAIDAQMARAAAVQVQDPAAATVLWQQVEEALLAQAPVVPAYNRSNADFVSKRVGNYLYHPQWGPLLGQTWVR